MVFGQALWLAVLLRSAKKQVSISMVRWCMGPMFPGDLDSWSVWADCWAAPHQLPANRLRCGGLLYQARCALWLWDRGWCENQDIAYSWLATADSSIKSGPSEMCFLRPWEGPLLWSLDMTQPSSPQAWCWLVWLVAIGFTWFWLARAIGLAWLVLWGHKHGISDLSFTLCSKVAPPKWPLPNSWCRGGAKPALWLLLMAKFYSDMIWWRTVLVNLPKWFTRAG